MEAGARSEVQLSAPAPEFESRAGSRFVPSARVIRYLRITLLSLPWLFIGFLLWSERSTLQVFENLELLPLGGAAILLLAAEVGAALLWVNLVTRLHGPGSPIETGALLRAFGRGWMARYIPGSIWTYTSRLLNLGSSEVSRAAIARSFVAEAGLSLGAATAIGVAFWTFPVFGFPGTAVLVLGGLVAVPLLMTKADKISSGLLRFAQRRWIPGSGLEPAPHESLSLSAAGRVAGGYFLINIAFGVAFALAAGSLVDVSSDDVALLIGAYTLSGVVGMLAPFVPAGLGVREAVLVGLAAPVLDPAIAASVAVIVRVLTIAADVLILVCFELMSHSTRVSHGD